MEEKGLPIEQVLKQVVRGVTAASNGAQEPWMEGSLVGDFCFGSCSVTSNETSASIKQSDDETALWRLVSSGKELEGVRLYLARYPDGKFSREAKERLRRVEEREKKISADKLKLSTALPGDVVAPLEAATRPGSNNFSITPDNQKMPAENPNGDRKRIIQVGVFTENSSARALRLKLARAGITTLVNVATINGVRKIRIRVGPFTDAQELQTYIDRIKGMGLEANVLTY